MFTGKYFVEKLNMKEHPEGGYYNECLKSKDIIDAKTVDSSFDGNRKLWTSIYFLLKDRDVSRFHRLKSDEIWYFHMGASVEMLLLYPDGTARVEVLGHDLLHGQKLQLTVPRGTWMGAQLHEMGEYGLLSTSMAPGYADCEFEAASFDALRPLLTKETLVTLQDTVANTYINEAVVRYIVALVTATRNHDDLQRGASPRATLSVTAVAKAVAQLRGRDYVTPRDVQEVFLRTVGHRLLLTADAESRGVTADAVLEEILKTVPAPKAN